MSGGLPGVAGERPRVAVLTGAGLGAIAVVRVWGPGALALVDARFRPNQGQPLAATTPGRLRVGHLGAGQGDEVVVYHTAGPPEQVEVQCHGGVAATALVLAALTEGPGAAEPVPAAAWVDATADSPLRAQAQLDLIQATTLRTAGHLLDQAGGALDAELQRLLALGDGPGAVEPWRQGLVRLLRWAPIGTRLVSGWTVALAGRPNVGKSSLMNALAGFERSIVSATPGTTRDVLSLRTALDGWPVELLDTAGLRQTDDRLERAGIAGARQAQAGADRIVLVLDASEPRHPDDEALRAQHPGALVVANKVDRPLAWDPAALGAWPVSALTGQGLRPLIREIGQQLVPEAPTPGTALPFRAEHVAVLGQVLQALEDGRPAAARGLLAGWLHQAGARRPG